jgi:hypothetical protein
VSEKIAHPLFSVPDPKWFMPQTPSAKASIPSDTRWHGLKNIALRWIACRLPEQADVTSVIPMGIEWPPSFQVGRPEADSAWAGIEGRLERATVSATEAPRMVKD